MALPAGTGSPLSALAFLLSPNDPAPDYPPTQQLVELLKMPTCVGQAQRIVLDHLGKRYHRTFTGPWEFVGFAREQDLDLDFTTPPQQPENAWKEAGKP